MQLCELYGGFPANSRHSKCIAGLEKRALDGYHPDGCGQGH